MIRYANFILELKRLTDEAKRLRFSREMHQDPAFRRWRHELETAVSQAGNAGFQLPGEVRVQARSFGGLDGVVGDDQGFAMYQREIEDTVIELETIISAYYKFGEPKQRMTPASMAREWEPRITLAWLARNAPPTFWIFLASALIAAFAIGVLVG